MKLIKLSSDHYIIVDDSEIKIGDCITDGYKVWQWLDDSSLLGRKKIVYSTEPIEYVVVDVTPVGDAIEGYVYGKVQELSLSEVKELLGEVDKFELFLDREIELELSPEDTIERIKWYYQKYFKEDNKDRKYTEEDMRKMFDIGEGLSSFNDSDDNKFRHALSLVQPPTQWDVQFVDGKLKLV